MQLTKPEIIQIMRKRAGLNQAQLGSRAFETSLDSGRTKIKNLELGIQRPTEDDLERIAESLDAPIELFLADSDTDENTPKKANGFLISQKIIDMFPDLGEYLEMIDKAARMDDTDLIDYLADRIAGILRREQAVTSPITSTA